MVNRLITSPTEPPPATDTFTTASTDGELLLRFRRHGDEAAFAQVIERHRPMIWGVCTRVLVRRADAEDAYQATWLILARKSHQIRENDSAGGWLFRVAHNTALNALRRRKALRETPLENTTLEPEQAFPDLEHKQLVGALLEELRAMPTKYQTPLVLRYLEGRSRREIAASMDATVATVAGLLVRGRRMLRSRLARRGVSLGLVLGALGGASTSHAGTIHAAPPAFSPALLASGSSGAVTALVNQGVRSMFYASMTKPAILGLASAATVALFFAPTPEHAAWAGEAEGTVRLSTDAVEDESIEGAGTAKLAPASADGLAQGRANQPDAQTQAPPARDLYKPATGRSRHPEPEEMRSRLLEQANQEGLKDYKEPTFQELYYQHMYWSIRKKNSQEQLRAFDQGGEVDQATHTAAMEDQVMAMAKIAEYERLMKRAALREVATPRKADGDQAATLRGGYNGGPYGGVVTRNQAIAEPVRPQYTPKYTTATPAQDDSTRPQNVLSPTPNYIDTPQYARGTSQYPMLPAYGRAPATTAPPLSGEIQPGETLKIEAIDTLSGSGFFDLFNGTKRLGITFSNNFPVDGNGDVALGARLGRVRVAGLTVADAEKAIKDTVSDRLGRLDELKRQAAEAEGRTHKPLKYQLEVQVTRRTLDLAGMFSSPNAANGWQQGNQSSWGPALTPNQNQPFGNADPTPEPNRKRSRGYGGGGEYGGVAKPKPDQGFGVPTKQRR